ncbi:MULTISPECIES: hypothetical protein [Asticcacaulis]|uniref:hypothetical protein n=1 Tax=Asticcacaulis TaxID=76890 RepID=UPI001FD901D8|nr:MULTISPECIES: hypothetical protein [Asticcacaulis]MBP2158904.1 major membrane immunogen (membrane-anchored lipoprotein) [Asticcacaulis solisilvae]MDR6799949.1 major membrane immunogen (membrane-anchored lipoprotein) [Asticcacaulis sp. BE141]
MKPERTGGNTIRVLAAVLCASLVLGACSSNRPDYDVADGARGPDGRPEKMRQSTEDNNDWGDAVTAPLEDLNLRRTNIPQILLDAMSRPYDLAGLDRCEAISDEVRKLDALLGPDLDEPPPPADESSMREKGGRMANKAAVGAVRGATRSIIPFRGLIRQMTGAEKHQKLVDEAIQAGKSRRAYLKGVGMNKNCAPPAAPSWFKPRVYIDTYEKAPVQTTTTKKKRPTSRRGGRR